MEKTPLRLIFLGSHQQCDRQGCFHMPYDWKVWCDKTIALVLVWPSNCQLWNKIQTPIFSNQQHFFLQLFFLDILFPQGSFILKVQKPPHSLSPLRIVFQQTTKRIHHSDDVLRPSIWQSNILDGMPMDWLQSGSSSIPHMTLSTLGSSL